MGNKLDLRGGMEKMREVARLLTDWAEDMERSLAGNVPDEPVAVPPEQTDPPAVTFDQARSLLAAKCAAGYRTQVQALINSFGATRFSEVDPSRYAELVEAAGLLGGDPDAG